MNRRLPKIGLPKIGRHLPKVGWHLPKIGWHPGQRPGHLVLALSLWGAAAGCGEGRDGTYPELAWGPASNSLFKPSPGGSQIGGDWFYCKDAACAVLADEGLHFKSDGTWSTLNAPGATLEQGESYCEAQPSEKHGTYQVSGETVTVTYGGDSKVQTVVFTLQGNDTVVAAVAVEGQVVTLTLRRVSPSRLSGPCQYNDVPMPSP